MQPQLNNSAADYLICIFRFLPAVSKCVEELSYASFAVHAFKPNINQYCMDYKANFERIKTGWKTKRIMNLFSRPWMTIVAYNDTSFTLSGHLLHCIICQALFSGSFYYFKTCATVHVISNTMKAQLKLEYF